MKVKTIAWTSWIAVLVTSLLSAWCGNCQLEPTIGIICYWSIGTTIVSWMVVAILFFQPTEVTRRKRKQDHVEPA